MSDTEGIGAKDSARFVSEVSPFAEVLARGARRLTRNDADAQDLLQDTLLHAYTGFHTFRTGSNLQAWLFRIMHNRSTDNYRRQQRRPPELLAGAISDQDLTEHRARESVGARSAESVLIMCCRTTASERRCWHCHPGLGWCSTTSLSRVAPAPKRPP